MNLFKYLKIICAYNDNLVQHTSGLSKLIVLMLGKLVFQNSLKVNLKIFILPQNKEFDNEGNLGCLKYTFSEAGLPDVFEMEMVCSNS